MFGPLPRTKKGGGGGAAVDGTLLAQKKGKLGAKRTIIQLVMSR